MGMWNYFRPKAHYLCPCCSQPLKCWEGREATPNYFLYAEGYREAFVFDLNNLNHVDEIPLNNLQLSTGHDASLIRSMFIYTECEECGCEWNAKCIVQNNIWIDTIFIDNTNIREIVPASEQPWMIDELNQNAEKCKLYNHLMHQETS